jgi:hypothetical protein
MDAIRFRSALTGLGLSQVDFARLVHVTARAVNMWATDNREIPGPAIAYLELLESLPKPLIALELARLKEAPMHEGMYQLGFQGAKSVGTGIVVLQAGYIFGSEGGTLYDGTYGPSLTKPDLLDVKLKITVPPGVWLVQGVPPQPMTYSFEVVATVRARGQTQLDVATPYGPVRAVVQFLRDLPRELAA